MLKEIKEKEFNRINGMIDSYTTDINDLVKQAEKVDEKYRKLAEQEKKEITEALDYYRGLRDELVTRRDSLGLEDVKVDKKVQQKKLQEAEQKEEVTDVLFPENNETPVEETVEEVNEDIPETVPEPVEEETSEPVEIPEVESSVEETTEVEDIWPDEDDSEVEEESKAQEDDEDDGWPDVVEEWK